MIESRETLKEGECHPGAHIAYRYIKLNASPTLLESLASCALSGNRLAEICYETLRRINNNEIVSDRYLMGLAWFIYDLNNNRGKHESDN